MGSVRQGCVEHPPTVLGHGQFLREELWLPWLIFFGDVS